MKDWTKGVCQGPLKTLSSTCGLPRGMFRKVAPTDIPLADCRIYCRRCFSSGLSFGLSTEQQRRGKGVGVWGRELGPLVPPSRCRRKTSPWPWARIPNHARRKPGPRPGRMGNAWPLRSERFAIASCSGASRDALAPSRPHSLPRRWPRWPAARRAPRDAERASPPPRRLRPTA
jgi:hypothetical protein